jgi:DNA-binding protein H-NS
MEFETNRNMAILFIIILVLGVGITYVGVNAISSDYIASMSKDINQLENEIQNKESELETLRTDGENFTYHLLRSMSLVDVSREIRSNGNLHFDYAARIWFPQKEYQKIIDNCTQSMRYYENASINFDLAQDYFQETKGYTTVVSYQGILDLYIDLSKSGYSLSMLRYNASSMLSEIAEKLLNESYAENTSELLEEFNTTLMQFEEMYQSGAGQHQDIVDEIEEEYGDFFNPNRKIP